MGRFLCPRAPLPGLLCIEAEWKADGTCSHCGSLHPAKFMDLVKNGAWITPAKRNYKCFVDMEGKDHKFYFQHLDRFQMLSFAFLHRNFLLRFNHPGCFTVLPYFLESEWKPPQ